MNKNDLKAVLKYGGLLSGVVFIIEVLFIGITGIHPNFNGWVYYFFIILAIILVI